MRPSPGRLAAIIVLLGQIAIAWVALTDDSSGGAVPDVPVTPATIPTGALTIESALAFSDPVAQAWNQDARLISASMEVLWPNDGRVVVPSELPDGGALTLVYAASDAQLSVLMDRGSGVIFHAEVGEWSNRFAVALDTQSVVRSSSIAVLAAEVSYGTSYRAACPEYRYVTRVYLTATGGDATHPTWTVSYVDERHRDRSDIRFVVDAVTGNTVSSEATSMTCEEE